MILRPPAPYSIFALYFFFFPTWFVCSLVGCLVVGLFLGLDDRYSCFIHSVFVPNSRKFSPTSRRFERMEIPTKLFPPGCSFYLSLPLVQKLTSKFKIQNFKRTYQKSKLKIPDFQFSISNFQFAVSNLKTQSSKSQIQN